MRNRGETNLGAATPQEHSARTLEARHDVEGTSLTAVDGSRRSHALRLHTRLAGVGGQTVRAARIARQADTTSIEYADGTVERWSDRAESTEQTWHFADRPSGDGALAIAVVATGMSYVHEDDQGHHFVDPATGGGFVYSHATWVDAGGTRSAIPVSYAGGELRMEVSADVLARTRYPAVLDPIVHPEFMVDDTVTYGGTPGDQIALGLACLADQCLAAYQSNAEGNFATKLVRFSPTGTVLDTAGLRAPQVAQYQFVGVFASGNEYAYFYVEGSTLMMVRVPQTGPLPAPISVSQIIGSGYEPKASFDGTNFLVVYPFYDEPNDAMALEAILVTPAGAKVGSSAIAISTIGFYVNDFVVSGSASGFLVAFADRTTPGSTDIGYVRLAPNGSHLDATPRRLTLSTELDSRYLRAAAGGGVYFVAYPWANGGAANNIYGQRIDVATGDVLDATPFLIQSAVVWRVPAFFDVQYDGSNFVIGAQNPGPGVGTSEAGSLVHRFTSAGVEVAPADGPASFLFPSGAFESRHLMLAASASHLVGVLDGYESWSAYSRYEVFGSSTPKSAYAQPTANWALAPQAKNQSALRTAWNGTRHLVLYDEFTEATQTRGRLLSPSGAAIGPAFDAAFSANVLVGKPGGFVAFTSQPVTARLIDQDGVPSNTSTTVGTNFWITAAAVGDTAIAALVLDVTNSQQRFHVRTLDLDGTPRGIDPLPIVPAAAAFTEPRADITAFGSSFAAVYAYEGASSTPHFGFAVIDPATALVTARTESTVASIDTGANPRVACHPTGCLVVFWNSAAVQLRGRLFDATGWSGPSFEIAPYSVPTEVHVRHDGRSYIVGWSHIGPSSGLPEVVAYRIDDEGTVLDAGGIVVDSRPLSSGGYSETVLGGLTAPTDDSVLAFYSARTTTPQIDALRVFGRVIETRDANGASCISDAQCADGICVDGVCCDSACGGGAIDDCMACSVAAGASQDGTCGVVETGVTCAAAASACANPAKCDGVSSSCPAPLPFDVAVACDDQIACTLDSCAAPTACSHAPLTTPACVATPDAGTAVDASMPAQDAAVENPGSPHRKGGCAVANDSASNRSGVELAFVAAACLALALRRRSFDPSRR